MDTEPCNIWFKIIGKEDGRWVVQAYDRNDQPTSTRLIVKTPDEAWKIFMALNGYHYSEPFEIETEKAS
jgi:hypothetical protein